MKCLLIAALLLVSTPAFAFYDVDDQDLTLLPEGPSDQVGASAYFPGFKKFYANSQVTVVPIPVFVTMPDEGQTYGVLPTVLITDPGGKTMKTIIAPQISYNTIVKALGSVAVLMYPNNHSNLSLFAGAAQEFYQEYEFLYNDKSAFNGRYYIDGQLRFFRNPYGRFFGLGPTSSKDAKTFYTANTLTAALNVGYNITRQFRLSVTERFLYVDLLDGINGKLPFTTAIFSPMSGVFNSKNLTNTIGIGFNSAGYTEIKTPTFRTELTGSFLFASQHFASQDSFTGTDWAAQQSFNYGPQKRFSTILRFHFRRVFGDNIPFYEMPSLGGPVELRGFTAGRFVDKGSGILQIEERIHAAHINFFNRASGDLYIDPFFEVGQVFNHASDISTGNLQPVGGLGVRMLIPPGMVARVDTGFSRENNFQVFTVLNYPF